MARRAIGTPAHTAWQTEESINKADITAALARVFREHVGLMEGLFKGAIPLVRFHQDYRPTKDAAGEEQVEIEKAP